MLEACLVCVDNSEWMRNGDYTPTRLDAQADAVNLICTAKTQVNPENTVGLMSYAGLSPEVHVTLTTDVGKILSSLHSVKINGHGHLSSGIQVAQLALKHRQNKNQRQRIVLFVGSPVEEDEKSLVRLGKKLKKNNVAVDVINFGEENENTSKLEAFIGAVNSSDNSHLVTVPPGPHILSDILISSPVIAGEDPGATAAIAAAAAVRRTAGTGAPGFEFGGEYDPELELALRISMEEERARQERENVAARGADAGGVAAASGTSAGSGGDAMDTSSAAAAEAIGDDMDEEAMLAQALALSLMGSGSDDQQHQQQQPPQGGDKKDGSEQQDQMQQ